MLQRSGIAVRGGCDWTQPITFGFLVAIFVLCALPGLARAASLQHVYEFDTSRLQWVEASGGREIQVPGLQRTWVAGQPELPFDTVTLLVPPGMALAAVTATPEMETHLSRGALATSMPRWTSEGHRVQPPAVPGKPAASFPAAHAEAMGTGSLHGYQLVHVRVHPVRYDADSGRVTVASRLVLDIELEPRNDDSIRALRFDAAREAARRRQVAHIIDNPEDLDRMPRPQAQKASRLPRGFEPTDAPSLEGSPVDYVIITSAALQAELQVLADWKTRRGVPTVVRTLEWIEANYRHGSDLQETIRTFIKDAYARWNVTWVLLAGDTDVIPARYGFSSFGPPTEEHIPSDMYFACLDGNWNQDGDDNWGEAAISAINPGDNTDLFAEVYLGRLPMSTPQEASNLIAKIMAYENPVQTTYQGKMLLLGEVLFPVDWEGGAVSMDGASFSQDMYSTVDTTQTVVTRLYENSVSYPGSLPLSLASTISQLNSGYGFVNHIGHGFRYNMSCGDKSLVNHDANGLTNGDQRFVLYMLNCTATAFDFPCLAEAYLHADTGGGAVAVLGSSRAAFAVPSRNYNFGFFRAVHDSSVKHIGEAFVESRLNFTPNAWYDTADHYTHLLYNMLADPEMIIHTTALGITAATFPASVGLGENAIGVTVTVNGNPRAGARVCLMKGTEEYVFGVTDGAGSAVLEFLAESAGDIQLTVSGQNMTTFQDTIEVDASAGPYVHVTGLTLDDDDSGPTAGNSDGFIDAGETVAFGVTLTNDGTGTASNLSGVLRCDDAWVTVEDSVYTSGSLAQGGSGAASGAPRLEISADAPDGHVLTLQWVTTNGSSTWNDTIRRVVRRPKLELTRLLVDDSDLGNNDGQIQPGESFELYAWFKNYGSGRADDLQLTLVSTDLDISVQQGAASIPFLMPLEENTSAVAFEVTENTLAENTMALLVEDRWGHDSSRSVTLRRPSPPAMAPDPDATQGNGIIALSWPQSPETDVVGYHVYRATNQAGPWSRVTVDRTQEIAYYRDTGLAPSTQYFYYVTAMDEAGNESVPSAISNINTSPAQMSGWPIVMGNVSSCPAVAGDIDGDDSKEIVAGNDHLYAWAWNGIELRDDDNDPQTWGLFADEINTITAAVLLAEFDPSPGLEIFATTWADSNKTFIVRGDGSFAPGWPQAPNPTSTPGYWGSPGAADVDGDGYAEVFAPSKNGNLYAWNGDGSPVGASVAFKSGLGTWSRCSPTFGNVDGDPWPEIIYASPTGQLHIWNEDGTNAPNFPISIGTLILSSSAVGDVNNDGIIDVVVFTENDSLYVIDTSSGDRLPGWPIHLDSKANPIAPSPALADFDFDGFLEIVVANNHTTASQNAVHVFDHQGNELPGWPRFVEAHSSESSPIVADFSGDGIPDVLFGNESGFIFGWDKDGNELIGFPLTIGDFIRSTPFADDVDGDGDIDLLLAGWDQNLWIWDFTAPWNEAAAQWPTFKHDAQRTGNYSFRANGTVTDTGDPGDGIDRQVPRRAFLQQNIPNPFNPVTRIGYGVPAGDPMQVRIDIFDVRGRQVRSLVRGPQSAGTYQAIWDGRSDRGEHVHSGVYFYRLQVGAERLQRKMLLLK